MRNSIFIFAVIILIVAIFSPGLSGGFYLDDGSNLRDNQAVKLSFSDENFFSRAWNSSASERNGARPLAMLGFAIEYATFGRFDPYEMKIVNLSLHLLNTFCVAIFLMVMMRTLHEERSWPFQQVIGKNKFGWVLLVATIWALQPPSIGSVLYVVQRMNLLATFFVLLGLIIYFQFRHIHQNWLARTALFLLILPLFVLGYLCKENAILGPIFILGFELFVLIRLSTGRQRNILRVSLISIAVLALIAMVAVGAIFFEEQFLRRPFDMLQRLALQPVAILSYIQGSFLPLLVTPRFYMDYMETAFFLSLGIGVWISVVIFLLILVISIWLIVWKDSLVAYVTIGWFFIFHMLESSVLPLEIAFQHRNYLPSVGLVAGLALLAWHLALRFRQEFRTALKLLSFLFVMALIAGSYLESIKWGDPYTRLSVEADARPSSPRAHYQMGLWIVQNDPGGLLCETAEHQFQLARKSALSGISGYFGEIISAEQCGMSLDDAFWTQLSEFIAESPFSNGNIKYLDILTESCAASDIAACSKLETVTESGLKNPTITDEQTAELLYVRSKLALYQGIRSEAVAYAQRALEVQPNLSNAHIMLLDLLYQEGNCSLLVRAYETLQQLPEFVEINRKLGELGDRYSACY